MSCLGVDPRSVPQVLDETGPGSGPAERPLGSISMSGSGPAERPPKVIYSVLDEIEPGNGPAERPPGFIRMTVTSS